MIALYAMSIIGQTGLDWTGLEPESGGLWRTVRRTPAGLRGGVLRARYIHWILINSIQNN